MAGKAKHIAGISLSIMGVGFAATLPFQGTALGGILQGGFEAGLVGGLADWFAVTALFRHPMGLPIPHTALVPKNRKRITEALVSTLENDWLSKESVVSKISQINITDKMIAIVERELGSERVKTGLASLCRQLILAIEPERIVPLVEEEIKRFAAGLDTSVILGRAIDKIIQQDYDTKAFDFLLEKAGEWAVRGETRYKLGAMGVAALENIQLEGFMQFALKSLSGMINEDKIGGIMQNLIIRGLDNLRHEDNANRQMILGIIRTELEQQKENQTLLSELSGLKAQILSELNIADKLTRIFIDLREKAAAFIEKPAFADEYLIPFLHHMLGNFKSSPKAVATLENWVQDQIAHFVEDNHSRIGQLVKENLNKLDDETLIAMMEDKIGKDLQWIRVNGAVCGFLIGLILVGVKALL
ncbi:DUF445 domain-containing protein [Aneurinibacillus sp. Ricciae_BoGa-3]|uniref:DUF445 domain-containing protein n=1 Tax=Aneurinibacillus sp. Ricciae_BoGa-3 TaxID=3022697 RepID=UPI002342011A|nr:DUF445 domain-containing protein [Aneurinibacillus sp. Ricciae_BoGa-3]WCK53484.1 DUF445 domain-containing protein [Aneurinibacillus sp. Ricciae_BoGa-3]